MIIHRPPAINQISQPLPDGNQDPGWEFDCGEACCASVLSVHTDYPWDAGCIRQMLGQPSDSGTFPGELANFLRGMRLDAHAHYEADSTVAYEHMNPLRHHGRLVIALGNWDGLGGHWELLTEWFRPGVWAMNPNGGIYQFKPRVTWEQQYMGSYVGIVF